MNFVSMPSRKRLVSAYEALQWGDNAPGAENLVLWAHWCRLDARLAELLVHFFGKNFRRIHPTLLWESNSRSPLPQALAVLLDCARVEMKQNQSAEEISAFENWAMAVKWKLPKASPQLFFLREGTPNPLRDQSEIEQSLRPYLKWGFYGSESPISAKRGRKFTLLSSGARERILRNLAKHRPAFSVADYIAACGGKVHRRTAERDLKDRKGLTRRGNSKGLRYQKQKPS